MNHASVTRVLSLLAAVAICAGVAGGTYLLIDNSSSEAKKTQHSAILDRAEDEGVISGYKTASVSSTPSTKTYRYVVDGGEIYLRRNTCNITTMCPNVSLFIEYRHTAEKQAREILKIAQAMSPSGQKIFFGPPYYP